jgi:hypothetical protein
MEKSRTLIQQKKAQMVQHIVAVAVAVQPVKV